MSLDPWLGCEECAKCEWAQELSSCQVLFECGHGRYWYLGDWVLTQVHRVYPLTTILVQPWPSIRLANLLANEEIARARVGHVVSGAPRDYHEFVQTQLQGCLADITVTSITFFPPKVNLHLILHLFIFFVSTFVKISSYCTFRLHLLKRRKRKKRIPFLAMLAALLVLSWRHIFIFLHGNIDESWWVIQFYGFRQTKAHPKCPLGWPSAFLNLLVSCPHFSFSSLSCSWTGEFVFQVGVDLVKESMQMIGGL